MGNLTTGGPLDDEQMKKESIFTPATLC